FGYCDIDMLAGPSEVVIIANKNADIQYIKADLMAQAEHFKGLSILVTPSKRIVSAVKREVDAGYVILTKNMEEAIEVTNRLAPEHLQIMVNNPRNVLKKINNAGAIFIGPYTPVAVGDYIAGPSHVLPTGGTAKFFSGLGIDNFVKSSHIISYTKKALEEVRGELEKLTTIEGLPKHMDSVSARFR
ncbi:MAG: histidinol dehydrogenase, partial [Candidatus Omnitrophica bacterium]|nr:histidinol dehydrogenase [Candidatus Omnitrophota bacterium]